MTIFLKSTSPYWDSAGVIYPRSVLFQQVSARASCTMGQSYAGEALLLETWSKHTPGGAAPLGLTGQWFPMGSLAFWGRDHRTADTSRQGHCTAQLQGRVRQDLCMHMGVCKCIWELFKHSKLQKIKMAQVPKISLYSTDSAFSCIFSSCSYQLMLIFQSPGLDLYHSLKDQ